MAQTNRRITAFLVLLAATLTAAPAFACDWLYGSITWTVPGDGAEVPTDAHLVVKITGAEPGVFLTVADDTGELWPTETETEFVARSWLPEQSLHRVTAVDGDFPPGTYTLRVEAEFSAESSEWEEAQEFAFEVVDGLEVDPPEAPLSMEWILIQSVPNDCDGHHIWVSDVEIQVQEIRDDVWYELRLTTAEGDAIAGLNDDLKVSTYLEDRPSCVEVTAVAVDGSRSEPLSLCEPTECRDRSEIVPCDDAHRPGGDGDGDELIDDPDDDTQEGEAQSGRSGCAATGSSPLPASLLVLALLIGLRARRTPQTANEAL